MSRTPAPEESPEHLSRRERLVRRRRHRHRLAVAAVVIVAVAGALGFGAYALKADPPAARAAGPSGATASPTFGPNVTVPEVGASNAPPPRALSHAQPLRLWIGGDSLAGSFGPALGDRVGATGIVQTVVDYKVSSGLWSNDILDWYGRATDQMASVDPEAVVFIIGTNDTPVVNNYDGNHDGVPDWQPEYRAKVDRMMDLLVGGAKHRTVFWLGAPTLGAPNLDQGAVAVDQVMREEAAKRAPDVVYVDTYKLFSAKGGGYSRTILDETGRPIEVRIGDGVHFTQDGAAYLARAVFALLDARWRITKQADAAQPIGWTLAPGSGETVPGYSSAPRSRYHSSYHWQPSTGGASPDSTAPVNVVETVPPATTPPTTPVTVPETTPVTSPPPPTTSGPHETTPTTAKA
ncbi:MAG TPA: DUF459 domain-containing protein [Acidimicrobiia bacterium]|nr:DUF459 domain-containing protein [Acidimicrobiia bacterium]